MDKTAELGRILGLLKEVEARYQNLFYNLGVLERERAHLVLIKIQLQENIAFLRRKKVVALAFEFKKIRNELIRVQIRLNMLDTDLESVRSACKSAQDMIYKGKQDYAKALKALEGVVIVGNFRGKNGQEPDRT